MKFQRPGNTEFNLIIAHFANKYCNITDEDKQHINNIRNGYIDWIYKTAGYYDKNIEVKEKYTYPIDYTKKMELFIDKYLDSLKNSSYIHMLGLLLDNNNPLKKYISQLEEYCNCAFNTALISSRNMKNIILEKDNYKKILIISPFKEIIDQQINSGNFAKIQPELNDRNFITYKFPYTFLNNGPHNDIFETLEYVKNDIKDNYSDFDAAFLSCGCYGSLLVDFIHTELNKDAIYVGGQLPIVFGIIGKRDKWAINELYNNDTTYLVDRIPLEYRPNGWEKIEDGCYW